LRQAQPQHFRIGDRGDIDRTPGRQRQSRKLGVASRAISSRPSCAWPRATPALTTAAAAPATRRSSARVEVVPETGELRPLRFHGRKLRRGLRMQRLGRTQLVFGGLAPGELAAVVLGQVLRARSRSSCCRARSATNWVMSSRPDCHKRRS